MSLSIFGTDGIRNRVGHSPFTYTDLPRFGHAIARWALKKYGATPKILMASDTRISASFVKSSLTSSMLLYPVTIHDAMVLPTPGLCKLLTLNPSFDFGIVISASHNPYHDNGIKIIDAKNGKLSSEDEAEISRIFHEPTIQIDYSTFGTMHYWPQAADCYRNAMAQEFEPRLLAGLTIVLDCAHGAAFQIAPELFRQLGAQVIALYDQPNGININENCGSTHPELLQKAVLEHHADAGFAFDGDADRVIAVSRNGEIKDGDDMIALLLDNPHYNQEIGIVGTIMSNHGLAVLVKEKQKSFMRAAVGDKFVSARLEEKSLLLGGEQSGHIIMRDYLNVGDGIFAALRALETMRHTRNWAMTTFRKFPQVLINVPVSVKKSLEQEPIAKIISAYQEQLPNGRVIVRYSGTESILRIMIEDSNEASALAIGNQLAQELQKNLFS